MSETLTREETAQLDAMRDAEGAEAPPEQQTEVAPETKQPEQPASAESKPADDAAKMVPHAAFHEERERRKAVEAQMQQMAARFDTLLQRMGQPAQPQQPAAPQLPDFATDPQAHITGRFQTVEQRLAQIDQWSRQQVEAQQAQQQAQAIVATAAAQEAEFRTRQPDYNSAAEHLRRSRDAELAAMGIGDPGQRQQMIQQDVMAMAAHAARTGQNVAEWAYNLAKLRGYQPAAAGGTNSAESQLKTIARGQQMGVGIGSQGSAPPVRLDAAAIARLSDDEFARLSAKDPDAVRRALGG